jgi:hypothetical protein
MPPDKKCDSKVATALFISDIFQIGTKVYGWAGVVINFRHRHSSDRSTAFFANLAPRWKNRNFKD